MQLKTLLTAPSMKKMEVVAGQRGLNREISMLTTTKTLNMSVALKPQHFLIIDGTINNTDTPALMQLITSANQKLCAGIGFLKENTAVATEVLDQAERLALPLVMLDSSTTLSKISQQMLTIILNTQTKQLNHIMATNQALADLLLRDPSGTTLLNKSEELLGHALFWTDSHFRVAFASGQIANQKGIITDFLRNKTDIDYFELTKQTTITYREHQVTIFPLYSAYKENKSFIGIYDLDTTSSDDQMLVQVVINSLSSVNSRIDMVNESTFRNQSGFFLNVMDSDMSHDLLIKMLKERNIDPATKFRCATSFVITRNQSLLSNRLLEQVQQLTLWFVKEYQVPVIVFSLKQQLVLLIDERQNADHFLQALVQFVQPQLQKHAHFVVGYSYSNLPLTELANIYNEAAEALSLSESVDNPISMYRPKYVKELLSLIPNNETSSFVERVLGGLSAGVPVNEQRNLLHTLQGYFFYHQNIAEVANHLFVHRNTVIYRLKKIEKLLGFDLNNPEETQTLEMAILLWANQNSSDLPSSQS